MQGEPTYEIVLLIQLSLGRFIQRVSQATQHCRETQLEKTFQAEDALAAERFYEENHECRNKNTKGIASLGLWKVRVSGRAQEAKQKAADKLAGLCAEHDRLKEEIVEVFKGQEHVSKSISEIRNELEEARQKAQQFLAACSKEIDLDM